MLPFFVSPSPAKMRKSQEFSYRDLSIFSLFYAFFFFLRFSSAKVGRKSFYNKVVIQKWNNFVLTIEST